MVLRQLQVQGPPAPPVATRRASWEASSPTPPPTQPGLPEPGASCGPEPTSWPCSCHHPIRSNCILPAANPGGVDVLEGYCQRQAPWREAGREEGRPPSPPPSGGGRGSYKPFESTAGPGGTAGSGSKVWSLPPALGPGLCGPGANTRLVQGDTEAGALTRLPTSLTGKEKPDVKHRAQEKSRLGPGAGGSSSYTSCSCGCGQRGPRPGPLPPGAWNLPRVKKREAVGLS